MFNQLQSWPTPEIFTRRPGAVEPEDLGTAAASLASVVLFEPETVPAQTETATAGASLQSCNPGGPMETSQADAGTAAASLGSVVLFAPETITDNEPGTAQASLSSLILYTPTSPDPGTETGTALVSLQSVNLTS